jgi:hypothetical protein
MELDYLPDVAVPMQFDGEAGYFVPKKLYEELLDKQDGEVITSNLYVAINDARDSLLDALRTLDNA